MLWCYFKKAFENTQNRTDNWGHALTNEHLQNLNRSECPSYCFWYWKMFKPAVYLIFKIYCATYITNSIRFKPSFVHSKWLLAPQFFRKQPSAFQLTHTSELNVKLDWPCSIGLELWRMSIYYWRINRFQNVFVVEYRWLLSMYTERIHPNWHPRSTLIFILIALKIKWNNSNS